MATMLVTGARQGLGLEFTRQYAADGWRVLATCLEPHSATELQELAASAAGRVIVHELDVDNHERVDALSKELAGESIDLLLNNAGRAGNWEGTFGTLDFEDWQKVIRTNLFGPAKVAEAFIEHVVRSEKKLMVTVASGLASLELNAEGRDVLEYDNYEGPGLGPGGLLYYRTSKAALDMLNRNLAVFVRDRGITVLGVAPGHVRTEMGGWDAPGLPEDSVRGMRQVIANASIEDTGKIILYDGREYPW